MTDQTNADRIRDIALDQIAQITLEMETLATRNSDSLDFKELAVWQIKAALETAYLAGQRSGIHTMGKAVAARRAAERRIA